MSTVHLPEMTAALEQFPSSAEAALSSPRTARVWTVFAAYLAAGTAGLSTVFGSFIAVGVVLGVVMGAQGVDPTTIQVRVQEAFQQPLLALLLALVPFQLGMAAVMLLAAKLSPEPLRQRLGLIASSGRTFSTPGLVMMAAFTLGSALAALVGASLLWGNLPANALGTAINEGAWWTIPLISIVLSLLPAIVEELFFRGYIQRRLLQRWSPAVAIGVTTVLFAILHADSLQHIIAVIPLALVTGTLAYRTNSVKPGMLVHALHNAGAVTFGVAVRLLLPALGEDGIGMMVIGTIAVLTLAGIPAVIFLLKPAKKLPATAPALEVPPTLELLAGQAA